jgi:hypothetical protein
VVVLIVLAVMDAVFQRHEIGIVWATMTAKRFPDQAKSRPEMIPMHAIYTAYIQEMKWKAPNRAAVTSNAMTSPARAVHPER